MNIIIIILLVLLGLFFMWKYNNAVKIKYRTFKEKGFRPVRGNFGLYCYCGDQGKGKTYSLVEYLHDNKDTSEIFCNVSGIKGVSYTHFTGFSELIKIKDMIDERGGVEYQHKTKKQLVIVYDELFTELVKGTKLSFEVMDFLCQMRKREIIFLTTVQYWSELPLSFRRFCRYQIDCNMFSIFGIGLLIKKFYDGENMKWSNEEQDHVAPLIETSISHTRIKIANSYNTKLRIYSGKAKDEVKN